MSTIIAGLLIMIGLIKIANRIETAGDEIIERIDVLLTPPLAFEDEED
jgi:hypothetical protein